MSNRFTNYEQAYKYASKLANEHRMDVAIRKTREFGKVGFNVSFLSKHDTDYYTAEIVMPYNWTWKQT
jgi:hypothetical protein